MNFAYLDNARTVRHANMKFFFPSTTETDQYYAFTMTCLSTNFQVLFDIICLHFFVLCHFHCFE
jgi:hypothetical protein